MPTTTVTTTYQLSEAELLEIVKAHFKKKLKVEIQDKDVKFDTLLDEGTVATVTHKKEN